jgi:hypothetical protein
MNYLIIKIYQRRLFAHVDNFLMYLDEKLIQLSKNRSNEEYIYIYGNFSVCAAADGKLSNFFKVLK